MENNNETKQKLLDTAMRLFKKHGYEKVTIDQICEAVGIAKNTYYYHFESKDSLLLAYMLKQEAVTAETLADILFEEKNYFEQFWLLQKKRMDVLLDCGMDIICQMRNIKPFHTAWNFQHKEKSLALEVKLIDAAKADGSVRNKTDSRALVATAAMSFFGLFGLWGTVQGVFDLELTTRSCYENIFDVRPNLRRGDNLYEYLISTFQAQGKKVKGKTHAR